MRTKEKIQFANPLYDVVFRYMMEDNKVAKLFLSAVIGKEIKELVFSPTEYSGKIGFENTITVTRMDFNARITETDGTEKVIIIELQKAKFYYQIMRFRKYLGKQYQNPQNVDKKLNALPIYPIYILGESFTPEVIPVIHIRRNYIDAASDERIPKKHPFIEALTHDATVIQVEHLKKTRRTVLEKFLSIFDQANRADVKGHVLAINENDYPKDYHIVIRRLIKALQSPKIEDDMDMEDEVIHEFNKLSLKTEEAEKEIALGKRRLMKAKKKIEAIEKKKEAAEKEKEAAEKEKEAAEKEKEAAEKEKEAAEKKNEEAEKKKEEAEKKNEEAEKKQEEAEKKNEEAEKKQEETEKSLYRLIQKLDNFQMSATEIAQTAGISETIVLKILKKK